MWYFTSSVSSRAVAFDSGSHRASASSLLIDFLFPLSGRMDGRRIERAYAATQILPSCAACKKGKVQAGRTVSSTVQSLASEAENRASFGIYASRNRMS